MFFTVKSSLPLLKDSYLKENAFKRGKTIVVFFFKTIGSNNIPLLKRTKQTNKTKQNKTKNKNKHFQIFKIATFEFKVTVQYTSSDYR